MRQMKKLEEQVAAWPHVSVHPHRFGGREFRLGNAELGHVHLGGTVDIPFTRAVRDALLADGLAEEHRWVPKFRMDYVSRQGRRRPRARSVAHALVILALRTQDGQRP